MEADSYNVDWNAADLPNGVYFYKLTGGDFTETKKMVIVKVRTFVLSKTSSFIKPP